MSEPIEWFEERIEFDTNNGCWLWARYIQPNGYGLTTFDGRRVHAHRLSWQLYFGEIPSDREICHRCDVRACVNPSHMFLGTRSDNMRDCAEKGRFNAPHGERSGTAVLTEGVVLEIARRLFRGQAKKRIARDLGVATHNVRWIADGKTWSWLTGIKRDADKLIETLKTPAKVSDPETVDA